MQYQVIVESYFDNDKNMFDEELNAARRKVVVAALTARGVADAEQRVVVGHPTAEGLYGFDAVRIGVDRSSDAARGGTTSTPQAVGFGTTGIIGAGSY